MKEITTTAVICLDDELGFTYHISKLEYVKREDETYTYTFTPNYSVMGLLPASLFQGIPGLDLEMRKSRYVRENLTPVFISERTPGENREELWKLLEDADMEYLNRLEWLIRTGLRYGGDRLYAKRWEDHHEHIQVDFASIEKGQTRSAGVMRMLLSSITAGKDIVAPFFVIDDTNRKAWFSLLTSLYRKEKSYLDLHRAGAIRQAAALGRYRGRQPKQIDDTRLRDALRLYKNGKISSDEAAAKLGISRSTFFRRVRTLREKQGPGENKNDRPEGNELAPKPGIGGAMHG